MTEEKLREITMKVRETLLNGLDVDRYDLIDLVCSIHNELYKEATGEYYDYSYH